MTSEFRQKVIFFAPILEYPPAGGPQLSVVNAVKVLHQISELHIITTVGISDSDDDETTRFFRAHCCALVQAPTAWFGIKGGFWGRAMRWFRRLASRFFAKIDSRYVVAYAKENGISIFWVDRVLEHAFRVFAELRRLRPDAQIVGDTCSVYSRFILRELPFASNPLRRFWISVRGHRKEREEKVLAASADVVTAVSELDARYFRAMTENPERIRLFSNIIDINDYLGLRANNTGSKPSILLLGSFGHANSPMDRAAVWMAQDVFPRVLQQVPEAHLYIVGRNADRTQGALRCHNITVVGQVPSVLPFLSEATLTVVPLHFESGTRFKILESGAASVPCVSTTLGAEGIGVTNGEDILIADSAEEFSAAVIRVLKDPRYAMMLGSCLHDLVSKYYSLETQKREGEMILRYLKEHAVAEAN